MTRIGKLYEQALRRRSLSFAEFERLLRAFGFELDRITGSHHIYRHEMAPQRLPVQPDGKNAKAYQVRQFLAMVDRYGLSLATED